MTSLKYYPNSLNRTPRKRIKKDDVCRGTIEPIELFYKLLNKPPMESLLGHTIPATYDGEDNTGLKSKEKKNPTHFFRYHDMQSGGGAIVYIPRYSFMHCRAFIKCVYVEPRHSKKGVATRCMAILKDVANKVDDLAGKDAKYCGDRIPFNHFELSLCPVPFTIENWSYEDKEDIDWGNGDQATEMMQDGSEETLDANLERASYQKLKIWYSKLGFVDAPYLDKHVYYDEEHNKIIEKDVLTPFSNSIDRHMMVYPRKNLGYYDIPANPGDRSAIPI